MLLLDLLFFHCSLCKTNVSQGLGPSIHPRIHTIYNCISMSYTMYLIFQFFFSKFSLHYCIINSKPQHFVPIDNEAVFLCINLNMNITMMYMLQRKYYRISLFLRFLRIFFYKDLLNTPPFF